MPYRDLLKQFESEKQGSLDRIKCPICGRELSCYSRDYLHTMIKHRFACKPCKVDISIKTEKEND